MFSFEGWHPCWWPCLLLSAFVCLYATFCRWSSLLVICMTFSLHQRSKSGKTLCLPCTLFWRIRPGQTFYKSYPFCPCLVQIRLVMGSAWGLCHLTKHMTLFLCFEKNQNTISSRVFISWKHWVTFVAPLVSVWVLAIASLWWRHSIN